MAWLGLALLGLAWLGLAWSEVAGLASLGLASDGLAGHGLTRLDFDLRLTWLSYFPVRAACVGLLGLVLVGVLSVCQAPFAHAALPPS